MIIRNLEKTDYSQYIELINEFRSIGIDLSIEEFEKIYDIIFKNSIIFVIEENTEIIATAKLIIEQKFIHKLAKYGFIEDVIVKGKHTTDYCKEKNFYKITLTCSNNLVPFYEKNGFEIYQNHMSQLL